MTMRKTPKEKKMKSDSDTVLEYCTCGAWRNNSKYINHLNWLIGELDAYKDGWSRDLELEMRKWREEQNGE